MTGASEDAPWEANEEFLWWPYEVSEKRKKRGWGKNHTHTHTHTHTYTHTLDE